ncbi:cytochrome P450 [Coprinellus micaceus]|uniref:Cytochrome P450 n=1 Tax=Coprinellus micaceus TaxID=71717 RepID=A0A4Y7T5N7_COPMI|nr:cytochrome P450 [Coprinellus micaceus]
MAVSPILKIFPSVLAAGLLWKIIRSFLSSHPLDKIPGPPAASPIAGNFPQMFSPDGWEFQRQIVEKYGSVIRLNGMFKAPILYTYDPKALYRIFIKDQHIYEEATTFIATNRAIFGDGLLSTLGDHHKKQRKMLNPVFSISHMRKMVPTFFSVTYSLRDIFLNKTKYGPRDIDMVTYITRAALEIVSQCGLGQSFDPLTVKEHEEHRYISSMKLLGPLGKNAGMMIFRQIVMPLVYKYKLGTPRLHRLFISLLPWPRMHKMRDTIDVMHETSVEIVEGKKKAMQEGTNESLNQKDFMTILLEDNSKASEEDRLPDNEVIAQISTLMFAAMDTTTYATSRILHLLALHQDVQDKLRAEIRAAKRRFDGEPDYDQLSSLTYLDAVIRETLRRHPPIGTLPREAHKDGILSLSKPVKTVDGKEITELHVPKGTFLIISIDGSNTNPDLWGSDSFEWKPERWLSPLPDALLEAKIPGVYSHLMTFIGGGRACIGFKFSEMEMKVLLYTLIDLFKFEPSKEIFWNHIGISTPSVEREKLRPELPLLVSRAA